MVYDSGNTSLAANFFDPQIPTVVTQGNNNLLLLSPFSPSLLASKLKFQLQGLNVLYEKNHTYYKVEGGLANLTLVDVTKAVKPLGTTLEAICFSSSTR